MDGTVAPAPVSRCLYVGDGSGDFHATSLLRRGDVVLAREGKGYALLKKMREHVASLAEGEQPTIVPWSNGATTLGAITAFLASADSAASSSTSLSSK